MSVTAVLFLIASSLYTGFQWTIRIVVYPQFARVPPSDFAAYERSHQRLVSRAVGPLFAALALSVLALVLDPPGSTGRWVSIVAMALVGLALGITALAAVPLHRRLSTGFDRRTHRRLLAVDTARLGVAVAFTALAAFLLVR